MIVTSLTVTNYRNIAAARFEPAQTLTVICGKNGQGKTNLLESVWLLTGGKSFRGAKDLELVREGCDFSVVEGTVCGGAPACSAEEQSILLHENRAEPAPAETELDLPTAALPDSSHGDKKTIRIAIAGEGMQPRGRSAKMNGVDYGRATNLAGVFTAVVFDPGHLSLVKGSPDGRRRFLDAALCQLYPRYLALLRRYTRLVTQKNALLKSYYQTGGAKELLDVFDEKLAECGAAVSERRQSYLADILPDVVKNYDDIASGGEALRIEYQPSFAGGGLLQVLHESRARDLAAGFCTTGPHREDFSIYIDDRAAKTYASQGQQRSAVLSLKLAEAAGAQRVTGEHPVMLLDDVLSELDDTRQSYLLNRMEDKQTIVTACDAGLFERTSGKIYTMDKGMLAQL